MTKKHTETVKKGEEEKSSGMKIRRVDYFFMLAGLALLSIIGPYLYYTG